MTMKRSITLLGTALLIMSAMAQPPANDVCSTALTIAPVPASDCATGSVQGTTVEAGSEQAAPPCAAAGALQDVWYTFSTEGFTNPFTLNITPGTIGHWGVQLFVGGCAGVAVACFDGSPSTIQFPELVIGSTYAMRLYTNTDVGLAGDLSLCLVSTPVVSFCGATVYDAGGPTANYPGGLFPYQEVYTYCPDLATQAINLSFTQFNTRSEDLVRIYNGPDINSPLLGTFSGNLTANLPGSFQSTHPTGCITLRFNYNSVLATAPGWAANLTCCLTPVVSVTPTSNAPICQGGTLQLDPGPTTGTTFVWTGPNGFTSTEQFPEIPNFNTANVGNYFVNASAGVAGCTSTSVPTFAGIVLPPSALTAGSSANLLCGPGAVDLSAQAVTDIVGLAQGFEIFPAAGWGTGGTAVSAGTNTTYFAEGARSVLLTHDIDADGQYGMTSNLDLTTVPNAILKFSHICALEQGYDYGYVEYSTNGGGSWAQLPANTYQGTGNSQFNPNARFARNSYAAWQSQFTGSGSNPGAGPATALWQEETFNLTQFTTSTQFRLRFRITSDASINYFGWLIDNVRILGTAVPTYSWTSEPAGFTSNEQNPTGVPLNASTIFTVTASTAENCSLTQIVSVLLQGAVPTIDGPSAITRCQGVPFDLSSSLAGGEAPFTYVWSSGGSVVGAGPNLVGLILNANTTVTLTVTDASGCQNTAEVEVTVAPPPVVTLAAQGSACVNWEPFPLVGGLPAGGTYLVNGVATTLFDPAAGAGVYTIVYQFTDANGCSGSAQRTLLVDACTGINELDEAGIRMYPNPASDVLYITAEAGRYEIRIHDASGRLVQTEGLDTGADRERRVALNDRQNGIYVVVIAAEDGRRWTSRLVIAR
jgi:hypothetical protein